MATSDTRGNTHLTAFRQIPIDHPGFAPGELDLVDRERVNFLPWRGQFSPELVERLLGSYGTTAKTILDPFMGSGTVLFESARSGKDAIGSEINPAANVLARTVDLVGLSAQDYKTLKGSCAALVHSLAPALTQDVHGTDLAVALGDAQADERIALEAAFLLAAKEKHSTTGLKLLGELTGLLSTLASVTCSQDRRPRLLTINSDARQLPLANGSADLIITSPPYVNVFNYHQQYRAAVESLGYLPLECARAEIGSNRKNRSNRVLTVVQYCLDIAQFMCEAARMLQPGGHLIMIIGRESNVRKTPFRNTEFVGGLTMASAAFELEYRFERVFTSRFGPRVHEDLLFLTKTAEDPDQGLLEAGREVAVCSLLETLPMVTDSSIRADIEDAIDRAPNIAPSPILAGGYPQPTGSLGSPLKERAG